MNALRQMISGKGEETKLEPDSGAANGLSDSLGPHPNIDSIDAFTELCHKLQANDKATTSIKIGDATLSDVNALALGRSLQGNTTVHTIVFDFGFIHKFCGSAFCFLDYIETSSTLLAVEIQRVSMLDGVACTALLVLLLAVGKNPAIREVMLDSKEAVVRPHLDSNSTTIKSFIYESVFRANKCNTKHLQTTVAETFRHCHHLESLWLEHLDDKFLCPLLVELQKLKSLKLLVFIPRNKSSVPAFQSLGDLLSVHDSMEHVELHGCSFTAKLLDPVCRGLANNRTVKELSLHDCSFDHAATNLFRDIFVLENESSAKNGIRTLTLGHAIKFYHRPTATVLVSIAIAPHCRLTGLDLRYCILEGQGIYELLTAMVKHSIQKDDSATTATTTNRDDTVALSTKKNNRPAMERLHFGTIHGEGDLELLKAAIPNVLGLRELSFDLGFDLSPTSQEALLLALGTNFTLEKCTIDEEVIIIKNHQSSPHSTSLSIMVPEKLDSYDKQFDGGAENQDRRLDSTDNDDLSHCADDDNDNDEEDESLEPDNDASSSFDDKDDKPRINVKDQDRFEDPDQASATSGDGRNSQAETISDCESEDDNLDDEFVKSVHDPLHEPLETW